MPPEQKQYTDEAGVERAEFPARLRIVPTRTRGKQIRPIRHRGIGRAAKELGVTRHHLYRVITGERRSPRIEKWLRNHMKEVAESSGFREPVAFDTVHVRENVFDRSGPVKIGLFARLRVLSNLAFERGNVVGAGDLLRFEKRNAICKLGVLRMKVLHVALDVRIRMLQLRLQFAAWRDGRRFGRALRRALHDGLPYSTTSVEVEDKRQD